MKPVLRNRVALEHQDDAQLMERKVGAEAEYEAKKPQYNKAYEARDRRRDFSDAAAAKSETYS